MPSMTYLPDWLALVVLVLSFMRINWETTKRLQNLCLLIIRHEKGAKTLQLAITLPGALIQAVILWFLAGLMNERASFCSWRAATQNMDQWHSPFILLSKEILLWKQRILRASQSLAGLMILIWLTADTHFFFRFLYQMDWNQLSFALREILATAGFWLWAYLAISISINMMPSVSKTLLPHYWGFGLLITLFISAVTEISSADLRISLTEVHENIARGLLGVLLLHFCFLLLYSSIGRIYHYILRFLAPHSNHQPETENNQAGHQSQSQ